jgi:raffinose/stachyose/melibiose transport system permease protein
MGGNKRGSSPGEPRRTRRFWREREQRLGYLFFAPALILVLILKGIPIFRGLYISFTRPVGVTQVRFAGLENYTHMVQDPIFHSALLNAAKGIAILPVFVLVPLMIAFLIYQRVSGWRFFRATYLFSYTLAPVAVGYMFMTILGADGVLNTVLRGIGLGVIAIPWFGTLDTALWALYAVVLWSWFGLGTIVLLAGLANVPGELFDAANVDGASWFQLLLHVTIPSILPTIGYWSVIVTTGLLIWLFPYIFVLTEGGPGYASMLPEYYIYLVSTRYVDPGYASAMGITLFGLVFAASFLQVRLMYQQAGG